MPPRVFVVQKQYKRNGGAELVPKFDFSSAAQYGELVYLLGPTAGPFNPDTIIAELRGKLSDFKPNHDFLLLVGNPCIIGWATALVDRVTQGRFNLLQWGSAKQEYCPIECRL